MSSKDDGLDSDGGEDATATEIEGEPLGGLTRLTFDESRRLRKEAQDAGDRTEQQSREALRRKVRMLYDVQHIRIQVAGRGLTKGTRPDSGERVEIELHPADLAILAARARELLAAEMAAEKDVASHLMTTAIGRFLLSERDRYKGIGTRMAGVIVAEFDIARLDTISKMWAFAGLAPITSRRCKTCHATVSGEDVYAHDWKTKRTCPSGNQLSISDTYSSAKAMTPTKGEKVRYNAWLRAKLIGVAGPSLLKTSSPWRKLYDDYKHRKESEGWGMSDGHRHNAAIRYMVKMLLLDIWKEWRAMEGLPVRESYQVQYLGHLHHQLRPESSSSQDQRDDHSVQASQSGSEEVPGPRQ